MQHKDHDQIQDRSRLIGAIIYFALAIIIVVVAIMYWWPKYFYDEPLQGFANGRRFWWCLAWVFFGFAVIALRSSKKTHPNTAWPSYAVSYPLALCLASSFVFSILQMIKTSPTYLFYFASAPISFLLAYHIDVVINKPLDFALRLLGRK